MKRSLALLFLVVTACGGNPIQSAECKKMIDCANAIEESTGDAAYGDAYGLEGSCWITNNAAGSCTKTCQVLLQRMASQSGAPSKCW